MIKLSNMTAIIAVPSSALEMYKSPATESWRGNRYTTDKRAIIAFLIFYLELSCFRIISYLVVENDTIENGTYINSTSALFTDTFSIINSTINSLNNNYSASSLYSYIFNESRLLGIQIIPGLLLFWIGLLIKTILAILCKASGKNWKYYTIMHASRAIIILAFLFTTKFQWINGTKPYSDNLIISLSMSEFIIFLMSIISFIGRCIRKGNFKRIFRFYAACRNLILFQLLIFMAMLSIIAWAVITRNCWFEFFLVILIMHNYAKMVITLATASHNWDEDAGGVSLKTLFSSIITIGRYHLGTIMMNLLESWCIPVINHWRRLLLEHGKSHAFIMKYSDMLTAIYGQNIRMAAKYTWHLVNVGQLNEDPKSEQSKIWADILNTGLYVVIFKLFLSSVIMPEDDFVEDLVLSITIFACYLLVNSFYVYAFISPLDTIKSTIKFCKNVKKEDFEKIEMGPSMKEVGQLRWRMANLTKRNSRMARFTYCVYIMSFISIFNLFVLMLLDVIYTFRYNSYPFTVS